GGGLPRAAAARGARGARLRQGYGGSAVARETRKGERRLEGPSATERMKMTSLTVIVPGRLDTRTGGYEYDRRMIAGLRERGWLVDVRELDGSFPHPTSAAVNDAAHVLAAIPDETTVLVDGLAFGAMPAEVEREASR